MEFYMRPIFSALLVMALSLTAASSFAADSRNISVINETGYAIKFLGLNAPDDGLDEWDNELSKTLQNQETVYVEFDDDDEGCVGTSRSTGRITMNRCSGRTSICASLPH
jgi:hypothetical protein